jgi:predicted AAA+ superfamily ATPase
MFQRSIKPELVNLAKSYPVVTVLGPRQSGKTTLVREVFKDKKYANLEEIDVRNLAISDPRNFLAQFETGAILDEIQRAPQLLSYIQSLVDSKDIKGMFILTGSHQMELHQAVSQSLAGRTAILTLLPMSLYEISKAGFDLPVNQLLLKGGYPRIYKDNLEPFKAYRNYFQTYVERDLRQIIQVKDLLQFERFVSILAGRIGNILNIEEIGGDIGVSSHTVKHWISILEASFIISRLPPYFENFGKRMIKSPKLYFNDLGLACYLLGIETEVQLSRDPLRGHLFENMVYLELKKHRINQGLDPQLYYYRDQQKNEIDFLFKKGNELIPIEVKSAETFHKEFLDKLMFFKNLVKDRAPSSYLVYAGHLEQKINDCELINFKHIEKVFN